MKLEAKTLSILKNFSSINPSIFIKEGNVLATISPNKAVMAKSIVPNNFSKKFGIYDLSRFLSSLSILETPEIEFEKDKIVALDSSRTIMLTYACSPEENIKAVPPDKTIKLPSIDVSVKITDFVIKELVKSAGTLKLPEVAFIGDGKNLNIQTFDSKNPTSDMFSLTVGETDKNFKAVFKVDNILKLLSGDYNVEICSKGISRFYNDEIEYWIAVEQNSTFS